MALELQSSKSPVDSMDVLRVQPSKTLGQSSPKNQTSIQCNNNFKQNQGTSWSLLQTYEAKELHTATSEIPITVFLHTRSETQLPTMYHCVLTTRSETQQCLNISLPEGASTLQIRHQSPNNVPISDTLLQTMSQYQRPKVTVNIFTGPPCVQHHLYSLPPR